MRNLGRLTVIGLLVVAATACGSDGGSGSGSGTSTTKAAGSSLSGTDWVLQDTGEFATEGISVTLEFAGNRVSGTSGCNNYGGPYTVQGSQLTIGPNLMSTQMACPPPADGVEARYLAALPKVASFTVKGDTLTLRDKSGTTLLVYSRADAQTALLGTWIATGYYSGTAIQSVSGAATLTATFADTTVNGDGGCNSFNGPYKAGSSDISIGPLMSTMKACTDAALSTQEQHYLAALQLAKTYRIRGDQLELLRDGGTIAATFQRASTG